MDTGKRIDDRYTVIRPIAKGGNGLVLLVKEDQTGEQRALKVLSVTTEGVAERLIQEGQIQARLDHPNIVKMVDALQVDGKPAVVMEFVEGPSLYQYLADTKPSLEQAESIFCDMLSAIHYAHQMGLIHRDIKPANVMLESSENGFRAKLTDFGFAKVLDDFQGVQSASQTKTGMALGTPMYMAPEQMDCAKYVEPLVDVFSLGCILYELVCGKRAFYGRNGFAVMARAREGMYDDPREIAKGLPERFYRTIEGALQPDQAQRIQSCYALGEVFLEDPTRVKQVFASQDTPLQSESVEQNPAQENSSQAKKQESQTYLIAIVVCILVVAVLCTSSAICGGGMSLISVLRMG
jgi:serine/threonine-protein kinase